MRTGDFNSNLTSEMLNESMFKKFGKRVNFERYSREQLENYRNVLRTEVSQMENTSGFNDLLANESYQQNKHMLELLNVRIKEMLGESARQNIQERAKSKKQQQAAGIALAAKKKGEKPKGKGAAAQMANMSKKELEKFASTPHKGLPVKKNKKKTKVSEGDVIPVNFKTGRSSENPPTLGSSNPTKHKSGEIPQKPDRGPHNVMGLRGDRPGVDDQTKESTKPPKTGKGEGGKRPLPPAGPRSVRSVEGPQERGPWKPTNEGKKSKKKPMSKGKPDFLDFDRDGNKKETMKKALVDKKNAKKGFPPAKKAMKKTVKKKSKTNEAQLRNNFRMILEGIRHYIAEDEEGKAMDITAGADMVKDFTSWMQRLGQYQTKSTIELADSIRSNFGPQEAEQFKSTVTPAIESALEALTASREIVTKAVSVLAGEEQPDEMMGQPSEEDEEMPSFEPGDDSMNQPPEEGGEETGEEDQFAASDAASAGRELRENRRQRQLRKLHEANSIMRRLAG